MISSSSSSCDFWNESIKNPETKSIGVSTDFQVPSINPQVSPQEVLLSSCPNSYFHSRLQELMINLRIGSEMQKEQELEKESRRLTRLFDKHIQELMKKQQLELLDMKKDYDSLKSLLVEKDFEISRLQQLLVEQELPLTKQRLFKKITRASLLKESKEKEDCNDKQLEINALESQVDALKELIKTYQEQTQRAENNLRISEDLLSEFKEKAEEDLKELKQQASLKENELYAQIEEMTEKYKIFKEEVKKEMEINSIVIKQQVELNNTLKRELKTAKMVLVTPRLREKFNSKLPVEALTLKPSRIKQNLGKKESTLEYLNSTRASPAEYSLADMSLQSSSPLVGLLPEISSRYISQ
jgi:hypothetical protein